MDTTATSNPDDITRFIRTHADWLKPFTDDWKDPAMDVYDELSDRPTLPDVDAHYTDTMQLMTWRQECSKI